MAQVLVIDSDAPSREYTRSILSLGGHVAREVGDGKRLLQALRVAVPDLVVCDLAMPGRGGIEIIHALHVLAPNLPVVAVSGTGAWDLDEAFKTAVAQGARLGLVKPVGPGALLSAIDDLLSTRSVLVVRNGTAPAPGADRAASGEFDPNSTLPE